MPRTSPCENNLPPKFSTTGVARAREGGLTDDQ
jgi:hypothetical protein